jgi:hypothetical protein
MLAASRRTRLAAVVGIAHFIAQVAIYALAMVVGPGAVEREIAGVSLYRIAEILTFPTIYLAERLAWSGIGALAFVLNSLVWALAAWAIVGVLGRPPAPSP